jgi:hypothetical protein
MREKLKKALDLIPEHEQDQLGQYLLEMIGNDEKAWDVAFGQSLDKLKKLGDEALRDFRSGETLPLNPDKL